MAYIPFDKMKLLREAARNGDERAKKILMMQADGQDFNSLLEEHFAPHQEKPVIEHTGVSDEKLKKFLDYNGVKEGDPEYESTVEAYYKEFPKARPQETQEPQEDDNYSIYDKEEDEEIIDDVATEEENDIFNKLMSEEIDAIRSYDDAILKVMSGSQYNENEKKGIIAKLEEIKNDEREHWEELKHLKENSIKKEENSLVEQSQI